MGAVQGAGDQGEHVGAGRLVELAQLLYGGPAGDVTARGAADAVADRQQPRTGVPAVLVVLADAPDVGEGGEVEEQARVLLRVSAGRRRCVGVGHRHFLSSRTVFPIRTWVPRASVVGWLIRAWPT